MAEPTPKEYLALAKSHLKRAIAAAVDPVDWTDLSTYGFYCLEAAVMAAASQLKLNPQKTHRGKIQAAKRLANDHRLPDVSDLLLELNTARKAHAYGDVEAPALDEQDLTEDLHAYVEAVNKVLGN